MFVLWIDEILLHLRSPGMLIPPANTNQPWFPMVSKRCRISSIHRIGVDFVLRGIPQTGIGAEENRDPESRKLFDEWESRMNFNAGLMKKGFGVPIFVGISSLGGSHRPFKSDGVASFIRGQRQLHPLPPGHSGRQGAPGKPQKAT